MSKIESDNRLGDEDKVKKGRLDGEEADIYKKRKTLSGKENAKLLSGKDRWYYFKDYYLKIVLIFGVMLFAAIYAIVHFSKTRPDEELYVAYVDCYYSKDASIEAMEAFADSIDVKYDRTTFLAESFSTNFATDPWLSDFLGKGYLDVVVFDKELFDAYAEGGYLVDLSSYMKEKDYKDFLIKAKDPDGNEKYFGIKCNNIPTESQDGKEQDTYLGVVINTSRVERSVEYLKFATTFHPTVDDTTEEGETSPMGEEELPMNIAMPK